MAEDGLKVMICVDGSEHSLYALKWYLDHLHKETDEVIFAHSSPYPVPSVVGAPAIGISSVTPDMLESLRAHTRKEFEKVKTLVTNATQGHQVKASFVHSEGDAGHELCKIAKSEGIKFIVLGTRGMGTIRRTILGSVSDYVLHHAHCPVTIVRKE